MTEALLASYEEVPYESKPIYPSHPDGMATMAILRGLTPPDVATCRVLELGCAGGGNLIPMALILPRARFVGIDLAPGHIEAGKQVVDALGITNLDLRALSILDVDDSFGQFDYVIAHGVYSWVPPEVQDKILAICARHLTPNGVAYISYNTYPGWHLRLMVRDMLVYHTRRFPDPPTRLKEAHDFLAFLKEAVGKTGTAFGQLIREEVDLLLPQSDSYLFHEQLESFNEPVYFWQFAERLATKGLQYLGEARFGPLDGDVPAALDSALREMTEDPLRREQYLDFLRARTFRRTLVCRAGLPVDRGLVPDRVKGLRAVSYARPVSANPDLGSDKVEEFRGQDGATASVQLPLVKAALLTLAEAAPRTLPFEALGRRVRERLAGDGVADEDLAGLLLQGFVSNLLELHVHEPPVVATVSERPVGSPLARFQAVNNYPRLTNLWHRLVELNPLDRLALVHLNGNRNRAELMDALVEMTLKDVLTIQHEGKPLRDPELIRRALSGSLEPTLQKLAGLGLLVD